MRMRGGKARMLEYCRLPVWFNQYIDHPRVIGVTALGQHVAAKFPGQFTSSVLHQFERAQFAGNRRARMAAIAP